MPIYYLNSGSINNLTVGNTLSAVTVQSAQSASLNVAIQGGVSTQVSQLVFSNANNHVFGLAGNTLTVSYADPVRSYYENIAAIQGTQTLAYSSTNNFVQPFAIPYNLSAGFMRFLMSNSYVSTTFSAATGANSYVVSQSQTWWANVYTQGTGTNSSRLELYAGSSATMAVIGLFSATSNSQTNFYSVTYPITGSTASTAVATFATSATMNIATTAISNFGGNRFFDIPFATSFSEGQYWLALQRSSNTTTAGNSNVVSNWRHNNSLIAVSQFSTIGVMGSTATTSPLQIGLGTFVSATATNIPLSVISFQASNLRVPFQIVRFG